MFITFFTELKSAGVPVSLREYLSLMEALELDLAERKVEDFYYLARTALVKDESNLDRFDRVFGHVFKGLDLLSEAPAGEIPEEWLRKLAEKHLSEEEKAQIEALGGFEKLMETLRERLKEQETSGIRAATSGSAPVAPPLSAPMATIRKGSASARRKAATGGPSRSGTSASSRISMTRNQLGSRNIQVALKRLRNPSPAPGPQKSWIWTGRSAPPPTRGCSM